MAPDTHQCLKPASVRRPSARHIRFQMSDEGSSPKAAKAEAEAEAPEAVAEVVEEERPAPASPAREAEKEVRTRRLRDDAEDRHARLTNRAGWDDAGQG